MKDLHAALVGADPVTSEPELPAEEALAIRRLVLAAARADRPPTRRRSAFVPIAAILFVIVAAGVALGWKVPERHPPMDSFSPASTERRQVQFASPGGTRIIWTLDSGFELRGTHP